MKINCIAAVINLGLTIKDGKNDKKDKIDQRAQSHQQYACSNSEQLMPAASLHTYMYRPAHRHGGLVVCCGVPVSKLAR
jgi:hypothetical protein